MSNKFSYVVIVTLVALCFVLVFLHEKSGSAANMTLTAPVEKNICMNGAIPSIEVNATESQKFQANKFIIHASIQMANKDKNVLFQQIGDRRNKIFAIAKELEISEKDVQQNSIELRKEWSYRDGVRKFVQYEGSQSFAITVDDKQNAANLVEALSIEFDIDVGRTTATLKNTDSLQQSVVNAAGKKAMEKAEMYAGSVGASLGKILNIGTGYGSDMIVNEGSGLRLMNAAPMMKGRMNMGADMNAIADSVTLSAEIRLVVEIKQ